MQILICRKAQLLYHEDGGPYLAALGKMLKPETEGDLMHNPISLYHFRYLIELLFRGLLNYF